MRQCYQRCNQNNNDADAATTDGNDIFGDLVAGTYRVRFVEPSGMIFVPQNVGNDANDSDVNHDERDDGGRAAVGPLTSLFNFDAGNSILDTNGNPATTDQI